jgi:large repetitive protein
MYNDSRHSGLRVQKLAGILNFGAAAVGGLVLLAIVAGSLIGLIPVLVAALAVIAGLAVAGAIAARAWQTAPARSRQVTAGVMAILVVALLGVIVFPHAGADNPLPSPGLASTAAPVASANPTPALSAAPSTPSTPATPTEATPTVGPVRFAVTGSMKTARDGQTATLLPDGSVLVAGGHNAGATKSFASAERYDPKTGTFGPTGSMSQPRMGHTATLIQADGGARVLMVGGYDDSSLRTAAVSELYDPATGKFSITGSLSEARFGHSATLLADGRVLVVGGQSRALALNSAEVYDPKTGRFTPTGPMAQSRFGQTATLLPGGKVLVAGGYNAGQMWLASTELFDPATGTFAAGAEMENPRVFHAAIALRDGRVLIAGGAGQPTFGGSISAVEIYDPATGKFSATGSMGKERSWLSLSLLSDGRVLAAGGQVDKDSGFIDSAEIFDAATGKFTPTSPMTTARSTQTATLLPDGRTLIVGGDDDVGNLSSAELLG